MEQYITCPSCGKRTVRKKRCMYCWAPLPEELQGSMGGTAKPYWHREPENERELR